MLHGGTYLVKHKKRLIIMATLTLLLSACGKRDVRHDISEYILETDYKEDFRILQLNDIHLSNKDKLEREFDFMDLTIKEADADLIVICGDSFTFADKRTAKSLFNFIDSYNTFWTITFGNHDEQCYFSIDWLTDYLNNFGSYCLFKDIQDDDITGNANFAINLMKDDKVHYQVIIMDSNRYNFGEYLGYDYIKDNQIAWYERLVNHTKVENAGIVIPSIAFFHIPIPEFDTAYKKALQGEADAILEYGDQREAVCAPKHNSGFFTKAKELNSTKAICVGHDHINNTRVLYQGVYLCYGINANDRVYGDADRLGGHVVTIHNDQTLSFDYLYHTYQEVE